MLFFLHFEPIVSLAIQTDEFQFKCKSNHLVEWVNEYSFRVPSKSTPRILPKSTTTIPKSAGIAKVRQSLIFLRNKNCSATSFKWFLNNVRIIVSLNLIILQPKIIYFRRFLKNFKPLKVLGHGSFGWVFEVERNLEGIVKWNRAVKRIALRGRYK